LIFRHVKVMNIVIVDVDSTGSVVRSWNRDLRLATRDYEKDIGGVARANGVWLYQDPIFNCGEAYHFPWQKSPFHIVTYLHT
jgi:hypothetical protein